MAILFLSSFLCICALTCAITAPELSLKLSNGSPVRGQYRVSVSGHGIRAFTDIPYAEPPLGKLRFSDPVPKSKWSGELPLPSHPIVCPQVDNFMSKVGFVGQEDCLYLNVYAPLNPKSTNLPVMFFIHGGGWACGTGNEGFYGPNYLLDEEDVILVTGNYRLSALGFLTTNTEEFTGNYGMKDQAMILKWIQENIAQFGGDPNKVTIFGESAGGASVGFHMISPMSKGLFHGAIMQSGTNLDIWAERTPEQSLRFATKLFDALGCPYSTGDFSAALECMREKNAKEIAEAHSVFYEWDVHPLVVFVPTTEPVSPNPFLTAEDVRNANSGRDIPLMLGHNANEGGFFKGLIADKPELLADLESRFDEVFAPILLFFDLMDNATLKTKAQMVKDYYFGGENFNWKKHEKEFDRFLTDGDFLRGFDRTIQQRLASTGPANTYAYLFNYRGSTSFVDFLMKDHPEEVNFGVAHVDELLYLFPIVQNVFNFRVMSADDQQMRKKMVKIWVNFATTGNPSSKNKWIPVTQYPVDYLRIGDCNLSTCDANNKLDIQMQSGFNEENVKFVHKFFQLPDLNVKVEL